jgi:replicative DNA helicase
MGKSALGLCMAANLGVRKGVPVALFTLEMSKSEVTQRLMCSEAKVESQRLRTGKLAADDWPRPDRGVRQAGQGAHLRGRHGLDHDDGDPLEGAAPEAEAPRARAHHRRLPAAHDLGTSAENRVQEVSQISRSLKVLARDLEVPIIALSQLSRAVEQRHDKRPILSDLRESGSLEQDADIVCFIYRDEYYNDESDNRGSPRSSSRSTGTGRPTR